MIQLKNIHRATNVYIRSILHSYNYWMAVALLFSVLFAEAAESAFLKLFSTEITVHFGDAHYFYLSLHFGYFIYAAPLAVAFASSGTYVSEYEAGYYRLSLMKSGRKEYPWALFLGSTLGGGLALMSAMLFFAMTCTLIFGQHYPATDLVVPDAWIPILNNRYGNWLFMLVSSLLALPFGMIWSGVGLTISLFSQNRYVSYLTPFMICFSSALMLPAKYQPLEMLVQLNWMNGFEFYKLLVYQSFVYLSVSILFQYLFQRKVIHEQS